VHSRFSSSNRIKLLRKFESICKTVLAHELGDPGVQFDEKTRGRKSRETVPLIIPSVQNSLQISFNRQGFSNSFGFQIQLLMIENTDKEEILMLNNRPVLNQIY
jgi:hypothetical protein